MAELRNNWQTKDSGERAQFESGMVRDTEEGKPRFDLTLPLDIPYEQQMLTRFAGLLARGAEKYTERNWEQAHTQAELNRYYSSAFRHFMQWITGETDEDHAAAVWFNIQCAEYVKYKMSQMDELEKELKTAVKEVREELKVTKRCKYEGKHQGNVCFSDGDRCGECGWVL